MVLHELLAMPSIASKHWIIRQYDHEVQGGTVIKPLVGKKQDGPGRCQRRCGRCWIRKRVCAGGRMPAAVRRY